MITLDFNKRQSLKVWAKEYDTARELNVQCIKDYVPIDITNCIITLNALKKDGTYIYNNGEIQDATNGKVTFPMTNQLLAVVGEVKADVSIYYPNDTVITSSSFTFDVDETIRNDEAIESANEFTELTKAIAAEANRMLAESNRVSAEQTRVNNETIRNNAENIRVDSESDRISAENGRVTAENNRVSAESGRVNAETSRVSAESSRVTAENNRVSAENGRVTAENNRVSAETARVNAETARQTGYATMDARINSLFETLAGFVGYTDADIYGVEVDFKNRKFTRLACAVNRTPGAMFDNIQAFGGRKRCILTDDGVVLAYHGEAGYTETGALTQAITIEGVTYAAGTPVQVMVKQPKFYYKVVPLKLEKIQGGKGFHMRKARYYVSDTMKAGFKLHPAFIKDGKEKNFIYLSAYEGSTFDTSASAYKLNDAQDVDFTAGSGDKLASIAYAKPTSGLTQSGATRNGFRTIAAKRGEGWSQETVQSATATEILFLVEYASFDMQSKIGVGVTNKTDDGTTSMTEITGATTTLGNKTGAVVNTNGWTVVSYRGQENPFGNIWKWIDGINIYNYGEGSVHIADHGFADNTKDAPYQDAGITIAGTNGYVSAMAYNEDFDWLFIASETVGNDKLPVGDYFYQNKAYSGYEVAILGGSWDDGSNAGGFCWSVGINSSNRRRYVGGRLLYVPVEVD